MARGKRGSAAILLVIMILVVTTVLAACSSGKNNAAESGGQAKESSSQPSATAQENKPPREIKWLLNDAQVPYATEAKANDPYVQKLSELSGYKLTYEFMDEMTYDEQLTLRYASGDLPDVIFTNSIQTHPNALNSGTFLELGELIDKYGPNLKKNIPPEAWENTRVTSGGKIYAIPALGAFSAKQVVYYRQDWLEKLGMEPPVTTDDYLAFFEAVKTNAKELTGGTGEIIPFGVRENLDFSELFFGTFGAHPYWQGVWRVRDGQLIPDIITPEMKEAIKFWKTLYDKGYVNKDMFTTKGADWRNRIQSGQTAMWSHNAEEYTSSWSPELFINQTGVKIGILGGPVDSTGKQALAPLRSPVGNVFVIPAGTKNPEDIIKFFDWAWSAPEAEEFFAYGIEGVNYTKNNGDIEWDSTAAVNTDKMASVFYQLVINPKGDGRSSPLVLNKIQGGDKVLEAAAIAKASGFKNDGLDMPALEAMSTHPELGFYGGTLFMDMFAKVVSGAVDADKGFDEFVEEWKRRGGDEAIQQATEWYNSK